MKRIELEKAYEIQQDKEITDIAQKEKFQLKEVLKEIDTYFSDDKEEFVKTRTCLRMRRTNDSEMELTYKPKSSEYTEKYGKREVNIALDINDYDDMKFILNQLGYKTYVELTKRRKIYSKKIENIEYNIMIDELENIGKYVEFEVITDEMTDNIERGNKLQYILDLFDTKKYKKKDKPYRDIAKEHLIK